MVLGNTSEFGKNRRVLMVANFRYCSELNINYSSVPRFQITPLSHMGRVTLNTGDILQYKVYKGLL